LRYKREDLSEKDTNKLEWKKAKNFVNDEFFTRISSYNPFGAKDEEYKAY
jgi:hypothetical protein